MRAGSASRPGATPWFAVAVAVLAGAIGLWFGTAWFGYHGAGPAHAPVRLQAGTALPRPKPLAHFVLTDQDGQEITEESLRGQWTFAAIGYTTCPDICPMTMATFVALQRQTADIVPGQGPRFLFISVDPERDTPERLSQYVRHFHLEFRGATGPEEVLKAVTRDLGGLYARVEDPKSALGYTMDHSAAIYLIDPYGRLTAIFSAPHDPSMMARDFAVLAQGPGPGT